MRKYLAAAVAALMIGGPAAAEETAGDAEGAKPGRAQMRERILQRFDADGDGQLSEDERAEARAARERMQRDGRGGKGRGKGQGRARGPERGDRGFEGRGPEGRGPQGRGPGGQRGQQGRRPPSPEQLFQRFDADGSGELSLEEFRQLADTMRARREQMEGRGQGARRGGPQGSGDRGFGPLPQRRGDFRPGPPGPPRGPRPDFDRPRPPRGEFSEDERRGPPHPGEFRRGPGRGPNRRPMEGRRPPRPPRPEFEEAEPAEVEEEL